MGAFPVNGDTAAVGRIEVLIPLVLRHVFLQRVCVLSVIAYAVVITFPSQNSLFRHRRTLYRSDVYHVIRRPGVVGCQVVLKESAKVTDVCLHFRLETDSDTCHLDNQCVVRTHY